MERYRMQAELGTVQVANACLHYELYTTSCFSCKHANAKRVLLIMGMGATATCWQPQIEFLLAQASRVNQPLAVCAFDNRGVGGSSSPTNKHHYSSQIMAHDALALMDHLAWPSAHVVAFSMGTQIATKLAAAAPGRIDSLTLIAAVGGKWHVLPRSVSALWTTLRCLRAKTPEQRHAAMLRLHFTSKTLKTKVAILHQNQQQQHQHHHHLQLSKQPSQSCSSTSSDTSSITDQNQATQQQQLAAKQKHVLLSEYIAMASSTAPQPPHGAAGQMHAVWSHKLTRREKHTLATATFPKLFIHGRHDLVAPVSYAHSLAERLAAPFVELPGAHFVTRESARQVNALLSGMIFTEASTSMCPVQQKDAYSMQLVSSNGPILALLPHEEHLVVRPITPTSHQHRRQQVDD